MIILENLNKIKRGCQYYCIICINIDGKTNELSILPGKINYDEIVDKLICIKYPNAKMQAIINNYLLDSSDDLVLKEFNEMQDYRKQCKSVAKEILQHYNL